MGVVRTLIRELQIETAEKCLHRIGDITNMTTVRAIDAVEPKKDDVP